MTPIDSGAGGLLLAMAKMGDRGYRKIQVPFAYRMRVIRWSPNRRSTRSFCRRWTGIRRCRRFSRACRPQPMLCQSC